jgi:mono/diheme cytochrome c family protein
MRKSSTFTILTGAFTVSWLSCAALSREAQVASQPASRLEEAPVHVIAPGSTDHGQSAARSGSPIQLGTFDHRSFAWVADADDKRLRAIDMDNLDESSSIDLGGTPSELVMLDDGTMIVSLRDTNEIVTVVGGSVAHRIPVPTEPIGLAITLDGETLLVTSGWAHKLTAIDTRTLTQTWSIDVAREPRKVVVAGWKAWVSHAMGSTLESVDIGRHLAKPIALEGWRESFGEGAFVGQAPASAVQGFTLAVSNGARSTIFAPRILARTDPSSFEGWGEGDGAGGDSYGGSDAFNPESLDVVRIDADTMVPELESQVLRAGFDDARCSLPRASLIAGERLFVACLGNDSVVELDAMFPAPHHAEVRRTKVPPGPMGLALDEAHDSLVVWSQFSRQISLIPLAKKDSESTALPAVSMAPSTRDPLLLRGKLLFHVTNDDRISNDARACASCHPDGREDGLVWQTNEGPRQTPMLAGRLSGTAPYGWRGQSISVEHHLKTKSLKRLGGKGLPEDDLAALVAYVRSIGVPVETAMPDPFVVARGEQIFNSSQTQCAECHGADGRTPDGLDHNVRSWAPGDQLGVFDTPSLRGVGQTAPYFHDGRYKSLRQLLAGVDGTMGHTKQLNADELEALEAYLRTR